jgi:Acyl dehydratase
MSKVLSIPEIMALVGTEVGVSKWFDVPQSRIDLFADATDDHQYIHVDQERAATTKLGGTIAHGFLSLSMLSAMNYDGLPTVRGMVMGINYGFNKVRFTSPVYAGARIRGRFVLESARLRGENLLALTYDVTVEIENVKRPALTANWITVVEFDPKERPDEA